MLIVTESIVPLTPRAPALIEVVARIVPVVIELATTLFKLLVPLTPRVPVVMTKAPIDPDKTTVWAERLVAVAVPRVESVVRRLGV